jgi:hypothetical protein
VYELCFDLRGFLTLPVSRRLVVLTKLVDGLAQADEGYLLARRGVPRLYESGVRYLEDDGPIESQWWDIPACLARGVADCKALAAWRAAELAVAGIPARPVVVPTNARGSTFHVFVERMTDGSTEDPSRALGMR